MEGTVLHYDDTTKTGIIRNDSGDRYDFASADWKSGSNPRTGDKVDFVASDKAASEIFVIKSAVQLNMGNVTDKLADFHSSDVGQKISALFAHGLHNKLGFFASLVVLISLFFSVVEVPLYGSVSLIAGATGKLMFVLLIVLAIFFYGGATKLYTRVLAGVALALLFFQYYNMVSDLMELFRYGRVGRNTPNLFALFQFGALINIIASVVLCVAAFFRKYRSNEHAL
ncbi:hypothetical protein [Arsukibacterium sp. MJ3]|uniref:hypothetical protein n=1 Tax=Arsukibacterium sp. MJ3 TaxID=1632859 RepID=UPI00069C428B|nr:hypothetical protein [Arsukibacterium sp. MJ3]